MDLNPTGAPGHADQIGSTPPRRRRASAVALVAAGLVGGVAISLTTNAVATGENGTPSAVATASPTPGATAGTPGRTGAPGFARPERDLFGFGDHGLNLSSLRQLGKALHGTATVPQPDGGFTEVVLQRGTVVSSRLTTLVVRSEDGFVATYVVGVEARVNTKPGSASTLQPSDPVVVLARVDSSQDEGRRLRATQIFDLSRFSELRDTLRDTLREKARESS